MKYYSEKLKKIFDTEEELKKAEEAVADESKIKEEKLKLLTEIKEKSNELLTLWNKLEELNKQQEKTSETTLENYLVDLITDIFGL